VNIFGFSELTLALVAAVVAAVPAIIAFVRGRQVARYADDPALPERLAAGRNVTTASFAVTIATLIVLAGPAMIWAIPLTLIAYVAAGWPLRRVLYNETWSFWFYLWFVIRFFLAMWSFWLLVCALPALALWSGERSWIVALVLGAGLMVLASRQTEVIRWLIGARPIENEAVAARFHRLVTACGVAAPHFEVVDLEGGSIANAFALPSLGRSAVVFTGPLLLRLDADEVDGICAHELAHLEYYNPRRMRHRRLVSRSLVVGGSLLTPLLQYFIPSFVSLACVVWPAVVLVAIASLVKDRQKHETASDLRAVALTGNAEALVRGLVKIHAIARMPRRWDADLERQMSHPSLKRRIQDIRAAAGTPPAALGDAAVFESADGTARVTFSDETLEWNEGASASYRVRYDRLNDLRIAVTGTGTTTLLAHDLTGHKWHMPLRREDVPRIQAVLDIIDARILTTAPPATLQPLLVRAAAFTALIVSLNAGLLAVASILAMTLARPDAPLLGAAGLAAIAGAMLTWRDPQSMFGDLPDAYGASVAALLVCGGALLIWAAYSRRRDEVPVRVWKVIGGIAVAACASWIVPVIGRGADAIGLHQAARAWPSSVVLPLALASALWWSPRRIGRIAACVAVVAGAAAAGIRSHAFLDRFGGDLFLLPAPDVKLRTLDRPIKEFGVPFGVSGLELSPSGRSIAVLAQQEDDRATIHIGRSGEALTPIDADGALFVDDDRALVWTVDGRRTELREVLVAAPEPPAWQLRVEGIAYPIVSLDANTKRWRLASQSGVNVAETREGMIGSHAIERHRWSVPDGHGLAVLPIALSGDRALVLEPRPDLTPPVTDPLGTLFYVFASGPRWRSTIWALGPDGTDDLGTSRMELECHLLPRAGQGACNMFDATRTRFFAMNAETSSITAVASLPGRFFPGEDPQGAWLTGWHRSNLIAVRIDRADAIRVGGPNGAGAHMLAVSDRVAAGVWFEMPPASRMRVEPLDEATGTSIIRIYSLN
jgi:Zn-dependent protease with chaperone function